MCFHSINKLYEEILATQPGYQTVPVADWTTARKNETLPTTTAFIIKGGIHDNVFFFSPDTDLLLLTGADKIRNNFIF